MSYFQSYLPAPGQLLALIACAAVLAGFAAIGNLLSRSDRAGGADLLAGWGAVAGILVPLQWLVAVDLRIYAAAAGLAAVAGVLLRRDALANTTLWRPAVLLSPVLVVACGVPLDSWDSFSHWGVNTAWLWRHDALPAPGLPALPSSTPDYPYGYPLALYFASLLRGAYIENAGAVVNALVLVGVAAMLARLAAGHDERRLAARPWFWSAWGALGVIVLNPAFVRSTLLATYADTVFAAAVLALCLAAWRFLETPQPERGQWLTLAALALAPVAVKPGGMALLGVLAVAAVLVGLRGPSIRAGLPWMLAALAPAALVAVAWQQYVSRWLPASFSLLPLSEWRFELLPDLLRSAGAEVTSHGHFYLMLAIVVALGARGGWLNRDRFDRLAALAALVVLGHLGTVLLAYLGATFTEQEVARAASFHRYATQAGLLALGSLMLALGRRAAERTASRTPARTRGRVLVVGCALAMVAGAPHLHRERAPEVNHYLERARALSETLPAGATVGLLGWQQELYAYYLMRYALFRPGRDDRGLTLARVFEPLAPPGEPRRRQFARLAESGSLTHLLVLRPGGLQQQDGPDMLLLARRGSAWHTIGGWRDE